MWPSGMESSRAAWYSYGSSEVITTQRKPSLRGTTQNNVVRIRGAGEAGDQCERRPMAPLVGTAGHTQPSPGDGLSRLEVLLSVDRLVAGVVLWLQQLGPAALEHLLGEHVLPYTIERGTWSNRMVSATETRRHLLAQLVLEVGVLYAHIAQVQRKGASRLERCDELCATPLQDVLFLDAALAEGHSQRRHIL